MDLLEKCAAFEAYARGEEAKFMPSSGDHGPRSDFSSNPDKDRVADPKAMWLMEKVKEMRRRLYSIDIGKPSPGHFDSYMVRMREIQRLKDMSAQAERACQSFRLHDAEKLLWEIAKALG